VRIVRIIHSRWRQFLRRMHAVRVRLRRERAIAVLLALLTLGLGEPLLCILHCQIILPIAFHDYLAAQIHHGHHNHTHPVASSGHSIEDGASIIANRAPAPFDISTCAVRNGSDDGSVPFHVPPSPIHDMVLALMLVFIGLPLRQGARVLAPGDPPAVFPPPPLRPPILPAA
jgi:hypothetical protein